MWGFQASAQLHRFAQIVPLGVVYFGGADHDDFRQGRVDQRTMASDPTMGSSLKAGHGFQGHVASAWTARSSFCSSRIALYQATLPMAPPSRQA